MQLMIFQQGSWDVTMLNNYQFQLLKFAKLAWELHKNTQTGVEWIRETLAVQWYLRDMVDQRVTIARNLRVCELDNADAVRLDLEALLMEAESLVRK
jgi:hypothetical protein